MPKTIHEGFSTFHSWLTPTGAESQAAKNHRASIEACLKNNFGLNSFFRCGSFGNGTSISAHSDVDYLASIPTQKLRRNSASTLSDVCSALAIRFPSTNVRTNCPAVCVPFGSSARETTEVVPADYVRTTADGHNVYEIADGAGGWMQTSPGAHKAYVNKVNDKHGGKVKPLIQFLKAWKFYRNVPISSFYLEMRVAKHADGESSIIYDMDVKMILGKLHDGGLAQMQDPVGIAGYIYPCSTDAKLTDTKSKLSTAYTRACNARTCESAGDTKDAFAWWDLVFGDRFPSYYN